MASSVAGSVNLGRDPLVPGRLELPVGTFVWWKRGHGPWQLGVRVDLQMEIELGFLTNERAIAELRGDRARVKEGHVCIWSVAEGQYAICTPTNIQPYDYGDEDGDYRHYATSNKNIRALGAVQWLKLMRTDDTASTQTLPSGLQVLDTYCDEHAYINGVLDGTVEPPPPRIAHEEAEQVATSKRRRAAVPKGQSKRRRRALGPIKDEEQDEEEEADIEDERMAGHQRGRRGAWGASKDASPFSPLASPPRGAGRRQRGSPMALPSFGAGKRQDEDDAAAGTKDGFGGGLGMMDMDFARPSRISTTNESQWVESIKYLKIGGGQLMEMLHHLRLKAIFIHDTPNQRMPRQPPDGSRLGGYLREMRMQQFVPIAESTPALPSPLPSHGVKALERLIDDTWTAPKGWWKGCVATAYDEQPAAAAAAAAGAAEQETRLPEGTSLYLWASCGLSVTGRDTIRKSLSLREIAALPPSQADIQECRCRARSCLEDFMSILSSLQRDMDSTALFSNAPDMPDLAEAEMSPLLWSRISTLKQLIDSAHKLRYERDAPQAWEEQPSAAAAAGGADEEMEGGDEDISRHAIRHATGGSEESSGATAALAGALALFGAG
ncbi:unnamed protein product [Vitrella brassicaformis CCMP3155]|uniref:Uncharacterized protein n=1 Tax=Vitrella brassicaformis (strain CCMP3155) TaxID=1169540 RepID=A0A0G4FYJ2_VITBC|nr:unnamed protein product [Vitrella brassicaformis CCMP3155]|eukprot:CEM20101.1 unnamed protein product [Vitrella brassicaformis CCMP3155]